MPDINETVTVRLKGRIDSNNAAQTEAEIMSELKQNNAVNVEMDASELEYISSAGLRMVLHVMKSYPGVKITGANPDVYEILQMTGFTEMMDVEKAYKVISIEGCEEIGRGSKGIVYRVDQDNVVKVYHNPGALSDIQHEREVARLALILGIPTAISYDVVKVGNSYGSVFELLNAKPFASILANEPDRMDWCVKEYVDMLKKIHGTVVPEGKLPKIKDTVIKWLDIIKNDMPERSLEKLRSLIEAVPDDDHMIHGDYHTQNIVLQGDEVLLIDMDTLSVGNPIFELAFMFNAYKGFSELHHEVIESFQGFDFEIGQKFWHKVLESYLGTTNERKIREVETKASIIGYTRLLRRAISRNQLTTDEAREEFEYRKNKLIAILDETDTLLFDPDELVLDAEVENLDEVQAFVGERLEGTKCTMKAKMQIDLVVEEVFVNIAHYAYAPGKGKVSVKADVADDRSAITITFRDRGMQYDPLSREDPDITLPLEQREVGGLGVYLTKKLMDESSYEYKDGQNILTVKKIL